MKRLPVLVILSLLLLPSAGPAQAQDTTGVKKTPVRQIEELQARIRQLTALYQESEGEDKHVFMDQLTRRWTQHYLLLTRMIESLAPELEKGTADSLTLATAKSSLSDELDFLLQRGRIRQKEISALLVERSEAPRESWFELEEKLADVNKRMDQILTGLVTDLESAGKLRMETPDDAANIDRMLTGRTELLAARIEAARENLSRLQKRLARPGAPTEEIETEINAFKDRVRWNTAGLEATTRLLERRGGETTAYRALLLEITGELGRDAFNPKVIGSMVTRWGRNGVYWLKNNGGGLFFRALAMVLVLAATSLAAWITRSVIARTLRSGRVSASQLLQKLLVAVASKVIWVFGFLVILSMLGINIGPMLAGLGIAGFILGFALQDTLSNFASGLMIMIYHPFDVGDIVTAGGVTGKVAGLTLVSTVITTFDNQRIVVPNSKVWGDVINNVTAERMRRVDLVFGISYADDIDKARGILEKIVAEHELVLPEPEPVVRLHKLGESSVDFVCRPWCKTEDYWAVFWDVTREVKKRFDAEGVSIPFPQRDVHLYQHSEGSATT